MERLKHSGEIKEIKIVGLIIGINIIVESPYILIKTNDDKIIKAFYSQKSFKEDFNISDLSITQDLVLIEGVFFKKGDKTAQEQKVFINTIYKMLTDFTFSKKLVREEWNNISEQSFKAIYFRGLI